MDSTNHKKGLAAGLFSFTFWGFAPVYFKLLGDVPAPVIIAHRIIWGVLFLLLFLIAREKKSLISSIKITPKKMAGLLLSGLLIATNWLMFVWAVTHDQILATSMGYFINPLVNILLGVLFLHEKLSRIQVVAISIAASATLYLGVFLGQPPWISLFLAFSFGFYGLVRKTLDVRPLIGLFWETFLLLVPSIIYLLIYAPQLPDIDSANSSKLYILLFFSGLVTILPLIGFNYAAKQLSLTIIGFLQYIAPTLSFIIAVLYYGETFTFGHKIAFTGIWLALLIVSWAPFKKLLNIK